MNIKLYQLDNLKFAQAMLESFNPVLTINSNDYHLCLDVDIPQEKSNVGESMEQSIFDILESFFRTFNQDDRPNGHLHRSVSVSDVVQVDEESFLCLPLGWKKIQFEGEEKVKNN